MTPEEVKESEPLTEAQVMTIDFLEKPTPLELERLIAEWYRFQELRKLCREIYNCMQHGMKSPTPQQYDRILEISKGE